MDDVAVNTTPEGTTVRMTRALAARPGSAT
jgi:hypothetical protein